MHLLLNQVLVRRIIRVQHLDRLPTTNALVQILALQRQTRHNDSQRQTLCVHPGLHQLLLARQVAVAADEAQRRAHAGDPRSEHDSISVVRGPVLGPLRGGLLLLQRAGRARGCICVLLFRVPRGLVVAGVGVGADNGGECAGGDDEEGAEGEG